MIPSHLEHTHPVGHTHGALSPGDLCALSSTCDLSSCFLLTPAAQCLCKWLMDQLSMLSVIHCIVWTLTFQFTGILLKSRRPVCKISSKGNPGSICRAHVWVVLNTRAPAVVAMAHVYCRLKHYTWKSLQVFPCTYRCVMIQPSPKKNGMVSKLYFVSTRS